jgi:hypothetical protein
VPNIVYETVFATTGLRLVEAGIGITVEPKSGLRNKPQGVSHFVFILVLILVCSSIDNSGCYTIRYSNCPPWKQAKGGV